MQPMTDEEREEMRAELQAEYDEACDERAHVDDMVQHLLEEAEAFGIELVV